MNRFKRMTEEYQRELKELDQLEFSSNLSKARPKITVEPMTASPETFDPKKHDFIVRYHKDGNKAGFIAVTHKRDGIMPFQFHVEKEHRRQGIGSKLAQHAELVSKKPIIASPDMTKDAVAWLKSYHGDIIKKSLSETFNSLIKSDEYAKKASTGVILLHPVTINGKTHRENGIPLHMTVKTFGQSNEVNPAEVEKHLENFSIPKSIDANKMYFMPHVFSGPNNQVHHVLLVYGAPNHIDQIRKGSEKYGQYIKNFLPHIAIDKEDWEKFNKIGPILPADKVGIKMHAAELRSGPQVLKRY